MSPVSLQGDMGEMQPTPPEAAQEVMGELET